LFEPISMTAAARAALFLFKRNPSYRKKNFTSAYYTKIPGNVQMGSSKINDKFCGPLPKINKRSEE
ncbi:hypothetical protein, partial [Hominenteromicrobium sp.]|uniref:hypothetical protein n=1 Tax=Hominenteromicrobium sp. TaxID=3073581 RepID=UPI003AF7389A